MWSLIVVTYAGRHAYGWEAPLDIHGTWKCSKPRIFPLCSDSVHPRYMWSIRPKHHVPLTSHWNTGFIFIIISGAESKLSFYVRPTMPGNRDAPPHPPGASSDGPVGCTLCMFSSWQQASKHCVLFTHTPIHVCMCVYIQLYVYTYIYIYVCVSQSTTISMSASAYIYICISASPGYNCRFFHTYAEEGAIGLAVTVTKGSHKGRLEHTLLQKHLLRLQALLSGVSSCLLGNT